MERTVDVLQKATVRQSCLTTASVHLKIDDFLCKFKAQTSQDCGCDFVNVRSVTHLCVWERERTRNNLKTIHLKEKKGGGGGGNPVHSVLHTQKQWPLSWPEILMTDLRVI